MRANPSSGEPCSLARAEKAAKTRVLDPSSLANEERSQVVDKRIGSESEVADDGSRMW